MRWFIFHCIMLGCTAVTLAKHDSIRPKRDFTFLKQLFKPAVEAPKNISPLELLEEGEDYKIFRVPGFKKILVKAIRKKTVTLDPANGNADDRKPMLEEDATSNIVGSYLGTKSANETLHALQGIRNLVQSGLLEANEEVVQNIMPTGVWPPIKRLLPHIPCNNLHSVPAPQLSKPLQYSYNQFHNDGQVTTFTAHDDQNVSVKNSYSPTHTLPAIVSKAQANENKIVSASVPLLPIKHVPTVIQDKLLPHIVSPVTGQTDISYKQIHKDGSITTYMGGSGIAISEIQINPVLKVENLLTGIHHIPSTIQQPQIVSPVTNQKDYSYKQIHRDGSITTYMGDSGVAMSEVEMAPVVKVGHLAPVIHQPHIVSPATNQDNYSYKQVHKDGSTTTYMGDSGVAMSEVEMAPVVKVGHLAPVIHQPHIVSPATNQDNYSYKQVHKDGSTTTYMGESGVAITEVETAPVVKVGHLASVIHQPHSVSPATNKDNYSYKQVHKDGSTTTYMGESGVAISEVETAPVVKVGHLVPVIQDVALSVHQPHIVSPATNQDNYFYKQVHKDGSTTNYMGDSGVAISEVETAPVVKVGLLAPIIHQPHIVSPATNQDNYSYKQVHKDGSTMTYMGESGVAITEVETAPVVKIEHLAPVIHQPHIVSPATNKDNYSYKQVHKDGSTTNYMGDSGVAISEVETAPVVKVGHLAPVIQDIAINVQQPHIVSPVTNQDNYSYKQVHKDGSTTTYEGESGVVISEVATAPVVKVEHLVPVIQDVPLSILQPHIVSPATNQDNYSYKHVSKGITTHIDESGIVVPEVQVTPDVKYIPSIPAIQNTPLTVQLSNTVPPVTGEDNYSYRQIHKDGTTTYMGESGVISETKPRPIIPELITDRIQHVATSTMIGKIPDNVILAGGNSVTPQLLDEVNRVEQSFPYKQNVHESSQSNVIGSMGSGSFSYKTVHNDGSVTSHSGSQIREERKGPLLMYNMLSRPNTDNENNQYLHTNVNNNINSNSYSYKSIQKDGSALNYLKNGEVEKTNRVTTSNTTSSGSVSDQKSLSQRLNSNTNASGFYSYRTVHTNASLPYYPEVAEKNSNRIPLQSLEKYRLTENIPSNIQENNEDIGSVTENTRISLPSINTKSRNATGQFIANGYLNLQSNINSSMGSDAFSYKTIHSDGTVTSYSEPNTKEKHNSSLLFNTISHPGNSRFENNLKGSTFSYKIAHDDSSVTEVSNKKKGTTPITNTVNNKYVNGGLIETAVLKDIGVNSNPEINTRIQSGNSDFSYKSVHNDGSATTYTGHNIIKDVRNEIAIDSNLNKKTDVSFEALKKTNTNHVNNNPLIDVINKEAAGRFSYKTVHNNGLITSYSNNGDITNNIDKISSMISKEPNRQKGINGVTGEINCDRINIAPVVPITHNRGQFVTKTVSAKSQRLPTILNQEVAAGAIRSDESIAQSSVLFAKPVDSRYMYKQVNHDKITGNAESELKVNINMDEKIPFGISSTEYVDLIPNKFILTSSSSSKLPLPTEYYIPSTDKSSYLYKKITNNGLYVNSDGVAEFKPEISPPTEAEDNSWSKNPIVVLDDPVKYSYTKKLSDSSSFSYVQKKNKVDVNNKVAKLGVNHVHHNRGDIPEASN